MPCVVPGPGMLPSYGQRYTAAGRRLPDSPSGTVKVREASPLPTVVDNALTLVRERAARRGLPEVHRTARRHDLGEEPSGRGLDVRVYDPGALWRMN
jgi:hypothetical protein